MRLFLTLLAVIALPFCVVGCGGDDDPAPAPLGTTSADGTADKTETADKASRDASKSPQNGTKAERQAVSAAAREFLAALASGDGDKACSMLAARVQKQLTDSFEKNPRLRRRGCAEILATVSRNYSPEVRSELRNVDITKVDINGKLAFVTYKLPGKKPFGIPAYRSGNSWKLGALGVTPTTTP